MNRKFGSKQIVPICCAALGVLWVVTGLTRHGFWDDMTGAQPGFVPIIMASILIAISILAFVQSFKEDAAVYAWHNWLIAMAGFGIFGATYLVGMIPAVAIFVILWLKVYEKTPWKPTIIVFAIIMSIVVGVFVMWLKVPFPEGWILEMLG